MPDRRPEYRLGLYCHGDLITPGHRAELTGLPGYHDWLFLPFQRGSGEYAGCFVLWHRSVRCTPIRRG